MPLEDKSNFNIAYFTGKPIEVVDKILSDKEHHVNRIQIPKRDGSMRNILAPSRELKTIQKFIYWRFLRKFKASNFAHGFVSNRSIVTNAIPHIGANSIGKIDIKSFFDTISVQHLQNCFFGNKNICRVCKYYERMLDGKCNPSLYHNKTQNFEYKCEELKAVFITQYCAETGYQSLFKRIIEACTYNGFTAQGFPTSPAIANIVMRGFDGKISQYCNEKDIVYTRYADDLAFSSKKLQKIELKHIIKQKAIRWLWAFGFKPNKDKIMWKSKGGRMKVCGIVVNKKTSVPKRLVHLFRAKVFNATVKYAERTTKTRIRQLKGWASYLMSVDHDKGKKYMDKLCEFEKKKFGQKDPEVKS